MNRVKLCTHSSETSLRLSFCYKVVQTRRSVNAVNIIDMPWILPWSRGRGGRGWGASDSWFVGSHMGAKNHQILHAHSRRPALHSACNTFRLSPAVWLNFFYFKQRLFDILLWISEKLGFGVIALSHTHEGLIPVSYRLTHMSPVWPFSCESSERRFYLMSQAWSCMFVHSFARHIFNKRCVDSQTTSTEVERNARSSFA